MISGDEPCESVVVAFEKDPLVASGELWWLAFIIYTASLRAQRVRTPTVSCEPNTINGATRLPSSQFRTNPISQAMRRPPLVRITNRQGRVGTGACESLPHGVTTTLQAFPADL